MSIHRPAFRTVGATALFFIGAAISVSFGVAAITVSALGEGGLEPAQPLFLAAVHALLLGGVGSVYFGAMHQLYPVVSERRASRSGHWALAHALLHLAGVALLCAGFAFGAYEWVSVGGVLVGLGLLILGVLALPALEKRCSWAPESLGLYLGLAWMAAVVVAGLWMAAFRSGQVSLPLPFEDLRGIHLRMAFAGFLLNPLFGLSHRLVPMFLITRRKGTVPAQLSLALLNGGLWLSVVALAGEAPWLLLAGDGLIALGAAAFAVATGVQLASRLRPLGGAFSSYLLGTIGVLACSVGWIAIGAGWGPSWLVDQPRWLPLALLLPVALLPFIIGVSARIIPFLAWQAVCAPWIGRRKLPSVQALWSEKLLWGEFALLALASLGWTAVLIAPGGALLLGAVSATFLLLILRLANCCLLGRSLRQFSLSMP